MAEKRAPQGRISMHARDSKLNELVGRTRGGHGRRARRNADNDRQ